MARRKMTASELEEWLEAFRQATPEARAEAMRRLRKAVADYESENPQASEKAAYFEQEGGAL